MYIIARNCGDRSSIYVVTKDFFNRKKIVATSSSVRGSRVRKIIAEYRIWQKTGNARTIVIEGRNYHGRVGNWGYRFCPEYIAIGCKWFYEKDIANIEYALRKR